MSVKFSRTKSFTRCATFTVFCALLWKWSSNAQQQQQSGVHSNHCLIPQKGERTEKREWATAVGIRKREWVDQTGADFSKYYIQLSSIPKPRTSNPKCCSLFFTPNPYMCMAYFENAFWITHLHILSLCLALYSLTLSITQSLLFYFNYHGYFLYGVIHCRPYNFLFSFIISKKKKKKAIGQSNFVN